MKITRRKLNQIITEEVKKALNEQNRYDVEGDDVAGSASSAISGVWMALSSLGGNPQEHTFKGRRQMLEVACAYLEGVWHHIAAVGQATRGKLAIAAIAAAEAKFKDSLSYDKQQGDKSICAPNKKWPKKGKCPAAKYGAGFPATVYNYLDMYPGLELSGFGGVKKQQIKYVLTVIYHFSINPEGAMKKYGDPREEISYGANYKPRRWSCK